MTRILITGENSYIGTSFQTYMQDYPEYTVDSISVRGESWQSHDFSPYDVVFHVAGIAHQKETSENKGSYYKVNYELTKLIGDKAKREGVTHFIFLSTMSVYGLEEGIITRDTPLKPKNAYGESKLLAEQYLQTIQSDDFTVAIVRPPMVYGKNCPGNYQSLVNISKKISVFPKVDNRKSMIFIDNLSIWVLYVLNKKENDVYLIQNEETVRTFELINNIAKYHNKKVYELKVVTNILKIIGNIMPKIKRLFNKSFGTLYYDDNNQLNKFYKLISLEESIIKTESRE